VLAPGCPAGWIGSIRPAGAALAAVRGAWTARGQPTSANVHGYGEGMPVAPPPSPRPTEGRRRARRGEGERLREEILEATAELLAELGSADKVSTRAVAQRVGCSSPALYLHFPDKLTLIYAVCEEQFNQMGAQIDEAMAACGDDLIAQLRAAAHAYVRFAVEHPVQYRIMMMDEEYGAMFQSTLAHLSEQAGMTSVVRTVQEAMDAGILIPDNPALTAVTMWAAVHGLVSLHLAKPGLALPPLDTLVDRCIDRFLDGTRPRPPG
jgi:AcrR family transcriptional regulator